MKKKIIILTLINIALLLFLQWHEKKLVSPAYPNPILSFEFAKTLPEAAQIIAVVGKRALQWQVGLSFLFVVSYSLFLLLCCSVISMFYTTKLLKRIGFIFMELSVLIGILHLIQNICMLIVLGTYGSDTVVVITRYTSFIRIILNAIVVFYLIIASIGLYLKRTK